MLALILPWSLRNSIITKRPSFLAVYSGINLFYGNNPLATGEYISPENIRNDAYEFSTSLPYTPENIVKCEREYKEEAKNFILNHVFYEIFTLIPARIYWYFGGLARTAETIKYWGGTDQGLFAAYPFGPKVYSLLLDWWIIYPLGCLGFLLQNRLVRWFLPSLWLAHLLPFLSCFASARYRFPTDIFLILPCAALCAKVLPSANHLVIRRILAIYCAVSVLFSGINWLRFSGPNLLEHQSWVRSLSSEAQNLSREPLTLLEPRSLRLWEVLLAPGIAPHLLLKFDYRIISPSNNNFRGPNISWKFLNTRGVEVKVPLGGASYYGENIYSIDCKRRRRLRGV